MSDMESSPGATAAYDWQPIASAPRDGSTLWVFDPERGVEMAAWPVIDGGWWSLDDLMHITADREPLHPTHWLPFPEDPIT